MQSSCPLRDGASGLRVHGHINNHHLDAVSARIMASMSFVIVAGSGHGVNTRLAKATNLKLELGQSESAIQQTSRVAR